MKYRILILTALLALMLFQEPPTRTEARIEGRTLREWVEILTGPPTDPPIVAPARIAPDLIPYLLQQIEEYHYRGSDWPRAVYSNLYGWLRLIFKKLPPQISNKERSLNALALLRSFKAADSRTMATLISLLDDEDLNCSAVILLGDIGPPASAAIPKLIDLLDHGQLWVATALGKIGPDSDAAILALNRGSTSSALAFRLECQLTLKHIAAERSKGESTRLRH